MLNGFLHGDRGAGESELDVAHAAFGSVLEHELERSKRGGRPLSVLIGGLVMDVDPASAASRAPSRDASWDALQVAAAVVSTQKRSIDSGALIGDDRFALILPDTGERGAFVLAERLRAAVPRELESHGVGSQVSFGIATFPRHGRSAIALIAAADRALWAARSLGGDRAVLESVEVPATIVSLGRTDAGDDRRLETLLALAETVDVRDDAGPGHSQTVGRYCEQIARELGMPVSRADRVRLAGVLHDLGKAAVPANILAKPGALDDGEWELVQGHVEAGAQMLDPVHLSDVREWVLAHHERPDGSGYPRGLRAADIPLEARILAVADAYEAMTSDRPHRPALTHAAAQAELMEGMGAQFDQRVVHAFLRFLEREGLRSHATLAPRS